MPNPKGHPQNLRHFTGKWQSGPTRTIRVPIALADKVLIYAQALDTGVSVSSSQEGVTREHLDAIAADLLEDSALTRNGKDRGTIRRALMAFIDRLEQPPC